MVPVSLFAVVKDSIVYCFHYPLSQFLEQTRTSIRSEEAAGIRAGKQPEHFFQEYDLLRQPYFRECPGLEFIDKESRQKRFIDNFDGFSNEHSPSTPLWTEKDGKAVYDLGKRVTMVGSKNESVVINFDDTINGGSGSVCTDLVIAADSSSSVLRDFLVPRLRRPYAGYVAWRGSVVKKDVSEESRKVFENKCAVFKMPRNYILMYTIPGKADSLELGERWLNFVWYYNCPETSKEFADIMTDSDGHRHRTTLPPGKIGAEE
ncbi:hypothetical protein MMC29_007185 [Sticta canariensis]|nr:hypothetical protein [Sticta canariensis]